MKEYNLIIVGGGAAGILCAIEANKKGIDNILLILNCQFKSDKLLMNH